MNAHMNRDCVQAIGALCFPISIHQNESIQEYDMPTLHIHIRIDNCFKEQQKKTEKGA